ncbi:MAG: PAS domain S-box protein [Anaeromyxobacter sp.]
MLRDPEFRILVEQSPMIIWRADASGACDWFNATWLAFTGRTMAEEVGDGWTEGVHPDDLDYCLQVYRTAFEKREPFEMEYRLRRHDGAWRWILDRGAPSRSPEGEFLGYIGNCVDVTERVEATAALKEAHRRELDAMRELIPLCFGCKSVRDGQGAWHPVGDWLAEAGKRVTHGLCEDCFERLYPEAAEAQPALPAQLARPA